MLQSLNVRSYTLIDSLELELSPGMTVISGETGAGKSIVLDALGLTLGNRADARAIRAGADRLEVSARFDLDDCPEAANWLREHECDDEEECLLRRTVNADGRSRAWINGHPTTLQDLKSLGDMLVDLHGQHEHHSLLQKSTQQKLLDEFGGHRALASDVAAAFRQWKKAHDELDELQARNQERADRQQLLSYQLAELEELALQPGEIEKLEQEQQLLANAGETTSGLDTVISMLESDDGGALATLRHALGTLRSLSALGDSGTESREMLESARIQADEARRELTLLRDRIEINPVRLEAVESRLSAAFDQARKHRVNSSELPDLQLSMQRELEQLEHSDETLRKLETALQELLSGWQKAADKLSKARKKAGVQLETRVREQLAFLGMENCHLEVQLRPLHDPAPGGNEQVEFLVSTNPGAKPETLARVASGGELSRISLAIQVITAGASTTPTIIFDEVDVGIGGPTADAVGSLLQQLGQQCQVICVTHLPQVASRGDQQLRATKAASKESASAALVTLSEDERVEELARMLGTRKLTDTTLEHAREMLAQARS